MPVSPAISNDLIRQYGIPSSIATPLCIFRTDAGIKAHPSYRAAKAGDIAAAIALVSDLAVSFIYEHAAKFSSKHIFVAPHAREAAGDNAIPQVLAEVCALAVGAKSDKDIVQITRVFHTGADPMERMGSRALFDGDVEPGGEYVLVDDVSSLGGTLAELANYIRFRGGDVVNVLVMVNAGRSEKFAPEAKTIRTIEKRFGNEITEILGIVPTALTANEAQYIVGFRTADEIRNRLAKARQETHLRLRSKGIGTADPGQESG